MKNLNPEEFKMLQAALPDYEIDPEPYIDWKPGDPTKNTGDMLLKQEYEASQKLPFGDKTVITHEGEKMELPFCAPEIIDWEATKKLHAKGTD